MCRTIPGRGQTESEKAWSIGRWASNSHRFISPGGQLAGGQQNRGARAHARTQRTRATPESLHEPVTSLRFGSRATRSMVPREVWVFSRHWPRPREWAKGRLRRRRRLRRSRLATPDLTPGAVVALLQRVRQGAAALWRANASPLPGLAGWLAGWHLAGPPSILRDAEHAPHPRSRRLGLSARGQPGTCAYLPTLPPLTHCPSRLTSVSGFDSRALPGLEPTPPVRCWFCRVSPSCHE